MNRRAAIEQIYREHFPFVWKSLHRLGVPDRDLSDAAQDVFMIAYRKLDGFEGRSKMTTWLYGIALRVASDRRRSATARREVLDSAPGATLADVSTDVSGLIERRQARRLLEAILDELPLEQRAVFTAFELDQMSGEQIAELLAIPLGTVWSRLRLARETFRRSIHRLRARERAHLDETGGVP
jgi:RNA polymerase sigma-70 factor, ECF subfamily